LVLKENRVSGNNLLTKANGQASLNAALDVYRVNCTPSDPDR
jgi:hypothetical protein